jgi:DNA adenine methylase
VADRSTGPPRATLAGPRKWRNWQSYDLAADIAAATDFLYCDPPYAPLNRTSSFTAYTARGFGLDDQRRLQQMAIALARRGFHVVLSNSTAIEIDTLYASNIDAAAAGLRAHRVSARRAINSAGGGRGPVFEYLITTSHLYAGTESAY